MYQWEINSTVVPAVLVVLVLVSKTLIQPDSDIHLIVSDHKHCLRTHSNIGLGDLKP